MTRRIHGSEAAKRERFGPLPWVVSELPPERRRLSRFYHATAFLIGIAIAYALLRAGL